MDDICKMIMEGIAAHLCGLGREAVFRKSTGIDDPWSQYTVTIDESPTIGLYVYEGEALYLYVGDVRAAIIPLYDPDLLAKIESWANHA